MRILEVTLATMIIVLGFTTTLRDAKLKHPLLPPIAEVAMH